MAVGHQRSLPEPKRAIVRSLVMVLVVYPIYYALAMLALSLALLAFGFALPRVFIVFVFLSAISIFVHYVNTWRDILHFYRELRRN